MLKPYSLSRGQVLYTLWADTQLKQSQILSSFVSVLNWQFEFFKRSWRWFYLFFFFNHSVLIINFVFSWVFIVIKLSVKSPIWCKWTQVIYILDVLTFFFFCMFFSVHFDANKWIIGTFNSWLWIIVNLCQFRL